MMEHLHEIVQHCVERTGYYGIFLVLVLGNLAVPVGTEVVLPLIGVLVHKGHISSAPIAVAVAVIGELVGGCLMWAVGRYGGTAFVHRFGKYVHLNDSVLAKIHSYYERYGARTVFFCRFLPVVRGVAALPAGLSGMSIVPFVMYTFLGSLLFCGGLIYLGVFLGSQLNTILPLITKAGFGLVALAVLIVIGVLLMRRRSSGRAKTN